MFDLRVNPDSIADPNLIALTNLNVGIASHKGGLNLQLARQPEIVGIEKCQITPARLSPDALDASTVVATALLTAWN